MSAEIAREAAAARARTRQHELDRAAGRVVPDYRVGLAASFTAEALAPFLTSGLLEAGFRPELRLAPYNQVFQACFEPEQAFAGASGLDAIAILWRIEDLLGRELADFIEGRGDALPEAEASLGQLAAALGTLRRSFAGTLVVNTPPFPLTLGSDLLDPRNPRAAGLFHAELGRSWREALRAVEGVTLFDFDAVQRHHGTAAAADPRKWYLYKQPYREAFLHLLGTRLAGLLQLTRAAPRKVAVLDCDNTLWGGVVGEDGLDGIGLGDEFPGSAFRDFQKLLVHWRSQGVMLALLTKNEAADVWEVFDRHDAMVLRREHVSAARIDWRPKAQNLPLIAEELGVGMESLVFIDDDPLEIEQVRAAWPDVACVQVPADPAWIVPEMTSRGLFARLEVTDEDRRRGEMMRQERLRGEVRTQLSPEEFLASLGLEVQVFAAAPEHVARIAQLINKTNQFNLTTRRRTVDEVSALLGSDEHVVYGLKVKDRFGDYGLTGVAILREAAGVGHLDTFLLSCRILGRQVETAFLAALAAEARKRGVVRLTGEFLPTAKNAPAADFFVRNGFTRGQDGSWSADAGALPAAPAHIRLLTA